MAEAQQGAEDLTEVDTMTPEDLPGCSRLTTKELQQNWRAVKQRERPVRLLFEIPSTRIVEHVLHKYVIFTGGIKTMDEHMELNPRPSLSELHGHLTWFHFTGVLTPKLESWNFLPSESGWD